MHVVRVTLMLSDILRPQITLEMEGDFLNANKMINDKLINF